MGRGKRRSSAGGRSTTEHPDTPTTLLASPGLAQETGQVESPRNTERGSRASDAEAGTTWYRLHSRGEPLEERDAWSEPLHPPSEDDFDDPDEYDYLYGVRSGYSCAGDPHHLVAYLASTDLRAEGNDVVFFRGIQTGHGIDGEPLVQQGGATFRAPLVPSSSSSAGPGRSSRATWPAGRSRRTGSCRASTTMTQRERSSVSVARSAAGAHFAVPSSSQMNPQQTTNPEPVAAN